MDSSDHIAPPRAAPPPRDRADDRPQGPATPEALAWVDGAIVPASQATMPLLDDGVLRGDAVFEVVPIRSGRTQGLEPHLARMTRSAAAMGFGVPDVRPIVEALLTAWPEEAGAVKLVVTRGGTLRGLVYGVSWSRSLTLAVVEAPWRTAVSGVKTLSYAANQWATRRAADLGADDALIVDRGAVMELPTGSLGLVRNGRIATTDPDRLPVLDSVTMRTLARVVEVTYTTIAADELEAADELFVVSATRPVLAVDAVRLADGRWLDLPVDGPVTTAAKDALDAHMAATLDPRPPSSEATRSSTR